MLRYGYEWPLLWPAPRALGIALHVLRFARDAQGRVIEALELAKQIGFPAWVDVSIDKVEGVFKKTPDRDEFGSDINESLIVELYSR